ncbi:MAG: TetR family transcriptional regulator [Deltaproteobacteria bacterium]|nr:MAG: TetR family transcriptional regulator [Deltaproteobacteria bacterium]
MAKKKLSYESIIAAATRRLDEGGLEDFSVRKVAKDLGYEAMSLYRYVPNKEAMLDGVHAQILSEVKVPTATSDWKADARALATALLDTLLAHPGALPLFPTRPAITETGLDRVEASLKILARAGLPESLRMSAMQSLYLFVVGHALFESHVAKREDDLDYRSLPAARYSNLRRVPVPTSRQAFRQGLDLWLRGIDQSVPAEEPQTLADRLRSFRIR